tara:strand:+ start:379 stop:1401 length:1023 start_codon:yes stop_codon:yes gene_type:complete
MYLHTDNSKNDALDQIFEKRGLHQDDEDAWAVVDESYNFVAANQAWCALLETDYADLLTTNLKEQWVAEYTVQKENCTKYRKYKTKRGNILSVQLYIEYFTIGDKNYFSGQVLKSELIVNQTQQDYENAVNQLLKNLPLIKSEADTIVDAVNIGISIISTTGTIIFCNENYAKAIGYTPGELMFQKNTMDISAVQFAAATFQGREFQSTNNIPWAMKGWRTKQGKIKWGRTKVSKIKWKSVMCFFCVVDWMSSNDLDQVTSITQQDVMDFYGTEIKYTWNHRTANLLAEMLGVSVQELTACCFMLRDNNLLTSHTVTETARAKEILKEAAVENDTQYELF